MTVTTLSWFLCVLLLLFCLLTSAITYVPEGVATAIVWQRVTGGAALLSGAVALGLARLPPQHWIRQSKPAWTGFVAAGLTLAVILLFAVVG